MEARNRQTSKDCSENRPSRFRFVTSLREADFVVRRVGARAGEILPSIVGSTDTRGYSPSSNLFVKAQGVDPQLLEARFRTLDFTEVRECVAANPSVSKSDVVALYGSQLDLERLSSAAKPHNASIEVTPLMAFRGECLS